MAWTASGNLRGPQGPKGDPGAKGDDGAGIEITGSVPAYGDLPGGLGPGDAGSGYLVEADGKLYIWSGTAFPASGSGVEFRGPPGPPGDDGPQGIQGLQGPKGDAGDPGATGGTGVRGSKWYTGTGAPTSVPGSLVGDMYLDMLDGSVYQLA